MTDDLVRRLRGSHELVSHEDLYKAADLIEKLKAELVRTFNHMMADGKRIEKLEAVLLVALGMLSEMGLSAAEKCELAYEYLLKHRSGA